MPGSDPGGMKTRKRKRYPMVATSAQRGSKMWISNAPIADVFVVWAKSEAHDGAIRGFRSGKGHEGADLRRKSAASFPCVLRSPARSSWTDVEVGEDALLPGMSPVIKGPFGCFNRARYGISCWACHGCGGSLLASRPCEYGLDRKQFGTPARRPHSCYQKKLADMQTEISLGLQAVAPRWPV